MHTHTHTHNLMHTVQAQADVHYANVKHLKAHTVTDRLDLDFPGARYGWQLDRISSSARLPGCSSTGVFLHCAGINTCHKALRPHPDDRRDLSYFI